MSLTPAKKRNNFDPVPAGNHVARLYEIIHVGTIPTTWQGQEKMTDKIRLNFELCNENKEFKEGEGEKPFSISREFTYSWGTKGNLRPFVEGFIGTKLHDDEAYNFNLEDLLGDACLLNAVHAEKDGNTYSNIQGASPLAKGMIAPEMGTSNMGVFHDFISKASDRNCRIHGGPFYIFCTFVGGVADAASGAFRSGLFGIASNVDISLQGIGQVATTGAVFGFVTGAILGFVVSATLAGILFTFAQIERNTRSLFGREYFEEPAQYRAAPRF